MNMDKKNIKVDLSAFTKSKLSTSEMIEKLSKALADFSPEDAMIEEAFQSLSTFYDKIDNSCIIEKYVELLHRWEKQHRTGKLDVSDDNEDPVEKFYQEHFISNDIKLVPYKYRDSEDSTTLYSGNLLIADLPDEDSSELLERYFKKQSLFKEETDFHYYSIPKIVYEFAHARAIYLAFDPDKLYIPDEALLEEFKSWRASFPFKRVTLLLMFSLEMLGYNSSKGEYISIKYNHQRNEFTYSWVD